eukprot:1590179-Amphidinium_carterae.1
MCTIQAKASDVSAGIDRQHREFCVWYSALVGLMREHDTILADWEDEVIPNQWPNAGVDVNWEDLR